MKRLGIVGSRGFSALHLVRELVQRLREDTVVVSGGARGVDSEAVAEADKRGLEVVVHKADWSTGKGAGYKRNEKLVKHVDGLIAFWDGESRGTAHAIEAGKSEWNLASDCERGRRVV